MIIDYVKKKTAKTSEICTEIYAHIAIAIIDADTTHTHTHMGWMRGQSDFFLNTIKITIKRIDFNESDFRDWFILRLLFGIKKEIRKCWTSNGEIQ